MINQIKANMKTNTYGFYSAQNDKKNICRKIKEIAEIK